MKKKRQNMLLIDRYFVPLHRLLRIRGVAQLVSAPRSGRGGRKFESSHPDPKQRHFATLAQLVEQRIRNA